MSKPQDHKERKDGQEDDQKDCSIDGQEDEQKDCSMDGPSSIPPNPPQLRRQNGRTHVSNS